MRIRNCLLTGGMGYIGRNFAKLLVENNIEPFFIDKSRGQDAAQLNLLKEIDYIVHLAAFPGVKNCKENLSAATIDNLSSAFRVFHIAHQMAIPVIFTSSQAAKNPEDNLYATIKRMIEIEAGRINYLNGDVRVLRLSNVFGGDFYFERKLTVIPKIVEAIERNEEFVINGTGEQKRDFVHVDDVCSAILKCMQREERILNPVDIGTGIGTSVLDLVKKLNPRFTFDLESDIIGPIESIADTKTAKELFDFEAEIDINDWIDFIKIKIDEGVQLIDRKRKG